MVEEIESLVFGGIIGALLASPNQTQKEELKQYKLGKILIENRKRLLGEFNLPPKLLENPKIHNNLKEAYNLFLFGFNRAAAFFSVLAIEMALRSKYNQENLDFSSLINLAKEGGLIDVMNYHFLTGLRHKRNLLAHDFSEITPDNAQIVVKLSLQIISKIFR